VDWFNESFKELKNPYVLEDTNLDSYQLFMAKKTGKPKDDFPSKQHQLIYFSITDIEKT
jgi:hypothetical protein